MIAVTFGLWDGAWPLVEFTLRARPTDPEVGSQLRAIDDMRKTHLWIICRRLALEGRIRGGHAPEWAADAAFALTTPTVYEEFVRVSGWSLPGATSAATDAVVALILEPGTTPVTEPPPDWGGAAMTSFGSTEP